MRIPVNSCEGCNQSKELTPSGAHPMGNGNWCKCAFLTAELEGYRPPLELIAVYYNRRAAVRSANKHIAGLLWIGQGPREMWAVVK
jgi:hypothetical protein